MSKRKVSPTPAGRASLKGRGIRETDEERETRTEKRNQYEKMREYLISRGLLKFARNPEPHEVKKLYDQTIKSEQKSENFLDIRLRKQPFSSINVDELKDFFALRGIKFKSSAKKQELYKLYECYWETYEDPTEYVGEVKEMTLKYPKVIENEYRIMFYPYSLNKARSTQYHKETKASRLEVKNFEIGNVREADLQMKNFDPIRTIPTRGGRFGSYIVYILDSQSSKYPNGLSLVTNTVSGAYIHIIELEQYHSIHSFNIPGLSFLDNPIPVSGRRVVFGGKEGRGILLFDFDSLTLQTIKSHGYISRIVYLKNRKYARIVYSTQNAIFLYNLDTMKDEGKIVDGFRYLKSLPDNRIVVIDDQKGSELIIPDTLNISGDIKFVELDYTFDTRIDFADIDEDWYLTYPTDNTHTREINIYYKPKDDEGTVAGSGLFRSKLVFSLPLPEKAYKGINLTIVNPKLAVFSWFREEYQLSYIDLTELHKPTGWAQPRIGPTNDEESLTGMNSPNFLVIKTGIIEYSKVFENFLGISRDLGKIVSRYIIN